MHYCSAACQTAHWANHEEECKKSGYRRQLYAAGHLLQQVFFVFREETPEQKQDKIVKVADGTLHIYDCNPDPEKIMFPFPNDIGLSMEDKQALLSHLACDETVQVLQLLERMLRGIHARLYEQTVRFELAHHRITAHKANGYFENRVFPHEVFIVALNDGHNYVIDLAGAQYGQHQAVMPMKAFYSAWVHSARRPQPLAGLRAKRRQLLEKSDICDLLHDLRVMVVQDRVATKLEALFKDWEQAKGVTIKELVQQEASTVEPTTQQLLSFLRNELKAFIQQSEADGSFEFERLSGYGRPTFRLR